jgi:hypothetical protein
MGASLIDTRNTRKVMLRVRTNPEGCEPSISPRVVTDHQMKVPVLLISRGLHVAVASFHVVVSNLSTIILRILWHVVVANMLSLWKSTTTTFLQCLTEKLRKLLIKTGLHGPTTPLFAHLLGVKAGISGGVWLPDKASNVNVPAERFRNHRTCYQAYPPSSHSHHQLRRRPPTARFRPSTGAIRRAPA